MGKLSRIRSGQDDDSHTRVELLQIANEPQTVSGGRDMEVDNGAIRLIGGCDLDRGLDFSGADCLHSAPAQQETTECKLVGVIVDNQDSHT
jgi:hypothetical protein